MTYTPPLRRTALASVLTAVAALLLLGTATPTATAHEVDQFTVPEEGDLADVGLAMNTFFIAKLEQGIERENRRMRRSRREPSPQPLELARNVRESFPNAVNLIEGLEKKVHSDKFEEAYGKACGLKLMGGESMFSGLHPFGDPRSLFRIWRASNIKVYGTYIGTDKIGHFVDMGHHYYRKYALARMEGKSEEEALATAVDVGTGDALMGEGALLGYWTAGAYSNGDLAANFIGMFFYRNLTEPVTLKGRRYEPVVLWNTKEKRWYLAPGVKEDLFYFDRFVSDHFDEVLNPSLYEKRMRNNLQEKVEDRAAALRRWYGDESGDRSPEWFRQRRANLETYHGLDYGHQGTEEEFVYPGNTAPPTPPGADDAGDILQASRR